MSGKRDLIPNVVLGVALVCVLIFIGAYLVMGTTSVGGNIALGLAGVALVVYVYLRPQEILGGLKSRQARYGGNTLLMTVIFIAILVLVNFLSIKQFKRWDLTEEKRFSLAPETVDLLKKLDTPITAFNFSTASSGGSRSNTAALLDQYRAQSPNFQVETIDPQVQPTLARQYGVQFDGTLVLVAGSKNVTINNPTESDITGGIIKITRATQPVVYITKGRGERNTEDATEPGFATANGGLERDGFQVKPLSMPTTSTIPADAAVVIVPGPTVPLQPNEVELLSSYLARGGRLMVLVGSSVETPDHKLSDAGLNGLLKAWGITLRDDVVIDLSSSQVTDPGVAIASKYGSSPITTKLGNVAVALPLARSLDVAATAPTDVSVTPLVQTSDQSWGASDLEALVTGLRAGRLPGPSPKDAKGPLTLAIAATNSNTKARLVVFGSASFATNGWSQWPGNQDMFLNSVNWLAEQESQITIRPKPFTTRQLVPSRALSLQVFVISVILIPLAVLVVGVIVWWRRR